MSESVTNDTPLRALGIALAVALVCALLVSTVAVTLRPLQLANIEAERDAQLELVLGALADMGSELIVDDLEAHIVDLASGRYDASVDLATFDAEFAASQPGSSVAIPPELDLAGIRQRALHARIYLARDSAGAIELVILPVYGSGYQSTLHAWLVLDGEARTVRALKFYRHGETPGVGARIEDPDWTARWQGLPAYDADGVLRIGVRTYAGGGSNEYAQHRVDGISGATRTSQGVDGMLRFWLGEFGFGPYLQRIREERL